MSRHHGDTSSPESGERIRGYLRGLSEGTIRIFAGLLLAVGLALCALALFGGSGDFGWKQFAVLIVSGLAIAVGGLLLARPQIVAPTVTIPPLTFGKAALISLGALLLVDWHLILGHVWLLGVGTAPNWAQGLDLYPLGEEGGLAEKWSYIKTSIAAGLLIAIAVRYKAAVLAAWALTLVVIVADDSLQIHERGGEALASDLMLPAVLGLRERDLGELLVYAGLAAIVLPLLALTHRISDRPARAISWRLAALLGALVFFAVVVDMLYYPFVEDFPHVGLVEDGGELVVSSLFLVLVIAAAEAVPNGTPNPEDTPAPPGR